MEIQQKSKEINFNGQNLCLLAKMNKFDDILKARYVIIKKQLNYSDEEGFCPIHYACKHLNFSMVEYLLAKGCDANIKTKTGESPLDLLERNRFDLEEDLTNKMQLHQIAEKV